MLTPELETNVVDQTVNLLARGFSEKDVRLRIGGATTNDGRGLSSHEINRCVQMARQRIANNKPAGVRL